MQEIVDDILVTEIMKERRNQIICTIENNDCATIFISTMVIFTISVPPEILVVLDKII